MVPPTVTFADRAALLAAMEVDDEHFDWEGVIASYASEFRYVLTRRFERQLWDRAASPWVRRRRLRGRPVPTRQSVLDQLTPSMPPAISYSVEAVTGRGGDLRVEIQRHAPRRMRATAPVRYTPRGELLSELAEVTRSPTARARYEQERLLADRPVPAAPPPITSAVGRVILGDADVTATVAERFATLRTEVAVAQQRAGHRHEAAMTRLRALIEADAAACDREDELREMGDSIAERLNRPM